MLNLFNSMSRSIEPFKERKKGQAKIFTCGPSVYRRPHIGNYRSFMFEDILVRYLSYCGYSVKRSIILTDIEDKAISEALKSGKKISELTRTNEKIFLKEAASLGIKLPNPVPRASDHIEGAVKIISSLLDKGIAYRHGPDIFFDPLKFKGFGRLFGIDMSKWPSKKIRFKKDTYPGQRWNLGDFILWHGYRVGDRTSWDTKIGKGRPSWNIEDPAVCIDILGGEIDINCGGIDNKVRHHDYNIAIIESITGSNFANYYLHGEHLIVEGRPMSKSRGNILYTEDIVKKGYTMRHLRFFLWCTHYRKKLNFTWSAFDKKARQLDDMRGIIKKLKMPQKSVNSSNNHDCSEKIIETFEGNLNDDLHVCRAFSEIYDILHEAERQGFAKLGSPGAKNIISSLEKIDAVMGVLL
jgi:cysteinyl-tRNA synthetase